MRQSMPECGSAKGGVARTHIPAAPQLELSNLKVVNVASSLGSMTDKHTHKQTHTHRDTHTQRHTHRDTHTQRHTHTDTHTHRHRHTHTQRNTTNENAYAQRTHLPSLLFMTTFFCIGLWLTREALSCGVIRSSN